MNELSRTTAAPWAARGPVFSQPGLARPAAWARPDDLDRLRASHARGRLGKPLVPTSVASPRLGDELFARLRRGRLQALAEGGDGLGCSGDDARWRVFISHTSGLRDFPRGMSYVAAVERAISAAGHVVMDMTDFAAADQPAALVCAERVQGCDVYVGVLGTRYGSPVRDRPEVSYTELEFDTASDAGLDRLMFLLDTGAEDLGIPPSALIDRESGARQDAFRRRHSRGHPPPARYDRPP